MLLAWLVCLPGPAAADVPVGRFSAGDLSGWEERSFSGHTQYRLVENQGETVLHAVCDAGASILFRKLSVDLTSTPWVSWRWRVDGVFEGLDERSKAGDDYPARLYVVVDGGMLPWRTRAVNYVWASREPVGSDWPNAYTDSARMLALRSGDTDAGRWRRELRNVAEDFARLHGRPVSRIDGVAVMTDCDNGGGRAEAWFGDIRFLAAPEAE